MSFLMEISVQTPTSGQLQGQFTIKTRDLCYKLSPNKYGFLNWGTGWWGKAKDDTQYILKNVSCEAKPGEITAIAGSSGAGKTTLLEILAGEIVPYRGFGRVLVNDQPLCPDYFRKVSGYVTQDEALFPVLSVEETLMYRARLRLARAGKEEASARVQKLLEELGLGHIAAVRIGNESSRGISGGEKRRVSIGVELVHDPAVLLIDEPTSGLDSASAFHVMLLLKSMAKNQGKTILLSIHQPGYRILELIDKVVLLSNGFVLHNGPLCNLEDQLKSHGHSIPQHVNVLEFAIDVSETLHVEGNDSENCEVDEGNNHVIKAPNQTNLQEKGAHYYNSMFKEISILAQRFSRNIFRTKQLFAARTIQALLAGILLGSIFTNAYNNAMRSSSSLQSEMGFLGFSLTFLLSSTTEALPIFLQEKRILMRETSRGAYRMSSYIIANTLVFLPFLLIVALLFSTPVYWLVGLRREIDGFLYFCLVAWMVISMSNSFVACFSALFPDYITGMPMIAAVMGAFFLFSGYFISKEDTPKCWIFMHYLSLFKYPFESFLINEFGGKKGRSKCVERVDEVCLLNADGFLVKLGLDESQKWNNLVIMLIFILGYRFASFLILWFKSYRSRY